MKELKDYLHLYLGAKVRYNYYDYDEGTWTIWETLSSHVLDKTTTDWSIKSIQIQLRPLSDMTDEEKQNDVNIATIYTCEQAERIRFLLSKHFDLFGLIEAGLAIDKTTLK